MLRDKIIHGIRDRDVQRKLLGENGLTLDKAVKICRTSELSKKYVETLCKQQPLVQEVEAIQTKKPEDSEQDY